MSRHNEIFPPGGFPTLPTRRLTTLSVPRFLPLFLFQGPTQSKCHIPRSNSDHSCGIPWSCTFCFFLLGSGSVVLNQYTSLTHPTPRYPIPSKLSVQLYVGPRAVQCSKDFSNKFPLFRSRSRSSRYEMEGGGDQQVNFLIRSRSH